MRDDIARFGGVSYHDPILVYVVSDAKSASQTESRIALPLVVCSTATTLVGSSELILCSPLA